MGQKIFFILSLMIFEYAEKFFLIFSRFSKIEFVHGVSIWVCQVDFKTPWDNLGHLLVRSRNKHVHLALRRARYNQIGDIG